jgi:hypothetical protein
MATTKAGKMCTSANRKAIASGMNTCRKRAEGVAWRKSP